MTTAEITPDAAPTLSAPAATDSGAVVEALKESHRRPATLDALMKKKVREDDIVISSVDEDGHPLELVLRYRALSPKAFDDLVAQYPPNPKQKADGMQYNPDTFGPALVAAVCIEPKMSVGDVQAIIDSGTWSPGEVSTLTGSAMAICQVGAGIPFTGRG